MKKYIVCTIILLAALNLKAGDTITARWFNKFTLGLNAGMALPLNQYGSKAANNTSDSNKVANGYANTGYHIDFMVSYPVYWKLGAIAYVGYNVNSFDVSAYKSANSVPTFSAKNYTALQYMAGPYFSMPLGSKFTVNARVMVGLVTINYPSQTTTTLTNSTSQWFNITSLSAETETSTLNHATEVSGPNGKGFAYYGSVGAEYKLGNKLSLALNIAYTGSDINYSSLTYYTSNVTNYQNKPNTAFVGTFGLNGATTTTSIRKFSNAPMNFALATAGIGITYHL